MEFDWVMASMIAVVLILVGLLGFLIYTEANDPHIMLNKTEWTCSHTHTFYQIVVVGKTTMMLPQEICDTYRMNGY